MLTPPDSSDDDAWFAGWRARELSRLERAGVTYLDYTGAALYPESLVWSDAARLAEAVLGNPHSQSAASRAATRDVEAARASILAFLNADAAEYTVVLTPNASGACRLVGEAFPFAPGGALALAQDNHNSVNGMREYAASRGASLHTLPLDDRLRLRPVWETLAPAPAAPALLALPAQSNFSGVRHPLTLVEEAQRRGWRVLLDAASYLASAELDLQVVRPDFVCLSLYKIAGYPTGLGALVARHDALAQLQRPAFAGGTVQWVSVRHQRHRLTSGAEAFEDGSVPFLAAGAVPAALDAMRVAGRARLGTHLSQLTSRLIEGLVARRHRHGMPRVRLHGPHDSEARGPIVAFSLLDADGMTVPYWLVEDAARASGLAVRGGCFCNPGCAERAFRFDDFPLLSCLDRLAGDFTIPALAECMGGAGVGAIRVSLGCGSVRADIDRLLRFVESYATPPSAAPIVRTV